MALDSMQEIFDKIQAGRKPFWQVVRDTDVEERQVTAEASFEKMHATWRAMVESVDTYRADRRSVSGLVGGDAQRMWDYAAQQETLCGPYLQVMAKGWFINTAFPVLGSYPSLFTLHG